MSNNDNNTHSIETNIPLEHFNNYDTFPTSKENNKDNHFIFKIEEESIKLTKSKLFQKQKELYLYYKLSIIIQFMIQLILIIISPSPITFTSAFSHFLLMTLLFSFSIIAVKHNNIYTATFFECSLCFVLAMDIWRTRINFTLLFYLIENILTYQLTKQIITIKNQL